MSLDSQCAGVVMPNCPSLVDMDAIVRVDGPVNMALFREAVAYNKATYQTYISAVHAVVNPGGSVASFGSQGFGRSVVPSRSVSPVSFGSGSWNRFKRPRSPVVPVPRFVPDGLCYSRMLRPEAAESTANALGFWPTLEMVLSQPREAFIPLSVMGNLVLVEGLEGCHVKSDGVGVSVPDCLKSLARTGEFPFGSLGASVRSEPGASSGVGGLKLSTKVGGLAKPEFCKFPGRPPVGKKIFFLAGSMSDDEEAEDWREGVAGALGKESCYVDPRGGNVSDAAGETVMDKWHWERKNMTKADVVLFNFVSGTVSGLSLLELGYLAGRNDKFGPRVVVVVGDGFAKAKYVRALSAEMGWDVCGNVVQAVNSLISFASGKGKVLRGAGSDEPGVAVDNGGMTSAYAREMPDVGYMDDVVSYPWQFLLREGVRGSSCDGQITVRSLLDMEEGMFDKVLLSKAAVDVKDAECVITNDRLNDYSLVGFLSSLSSARDVVVKGSLGDYCLRRGKGFKEDSRNHGHPLVALGFRFTDKSDSAVRFSDL